MVKYIVLSGPKHCGKTGAGIELASLLSCGFVDLDAEIEKRCGKSPRALYNLGPDIFRKAETAAVTALFERETAGALFVIAAGGGIIDNPIAMDCLTAAGAFIVFLDVSAQTAWRRIAGAGELPPFLQTANPEQTHRSLHSRRGEAYRQAASLVIQADGKTPKETAHEIACAAPFHQQK